MTETFIVEESRVHCRNTRFQNSSDASINIDCDNNRTELHNLFDNGSHQVHERRKTSK